MRKSILAICVVFSFAIGAYSQTAVIPKVGMAITSAEADPEIGNQQSLQSVFFGLGIEARVNDLVSVQPELLYIRKGVEWDVLIADTRRTINYIELPLLLKLNFPVSNFLIY